MKPICLLAQVQTKSNFRNLNGVFYPVDEINKNRVTCIIFDFEFQKYIKVDFDISEITEFKTV